MMVERLIALTFALLRETLLSNGRNAGFGEPTPPSDRLRR